MRSGNDMVERVAKAIYATWAQETGITETWEDVVRVGHSIVHLATKEAKAAIETMREPTEGMMLAGGLKMEGMIFENDEDYTGVIFKDTAIVYSTMLDAALKEAEKT